jgi:dsDNA-binding SOS-regulon protein
MPMIRCWNWQNCSPLMKNVAGLSEKHAEDASIFMAKNRAVFAAAFKSNALALNELAPAAEQAE